MAKDPAILLYIDKWITATQGMRAESKGWYLELILYQFDKGNLPNDLDELASICRIRPSEFNLFKQVFEQVLKQKFKEKDNGTLENDFANEILQKRQRFIEKRSNAGKLSYVLKYFRINFKINKGLEQFIKDNIDLNFDIKNEQVLKQVFEQISELYINENVNVNINIDEKENYIVLFEKLNLEFKLSKEFSEQILLWLKYKSEKGQSYKETGMKTLIKGLLKDSNNEIETAKQMIEYSMKNNYSGIFKQNLTNKSKIIKHDTDF